MEKRKIMIIASALMALGLMSSCRYNPLDSYSRIPPDRGGQEGKDDEGGLGGKFAKGFGTSESPYVIRSANHLRNMNLALIPGEMVYFSLESDIDISQYGWTPLNNLEPYSNFIDFEGNGHIIRGLKCSDNGYDSFFGILCGSCRNVGFIKADVSGDKASAVIAAYVGIRSPSSANFTGFIENCFVEGTVSGKPAGGIAGYMGSAYNSSYCYIKNCYSAATVTSTASAGGVAGQLQKGAEVSNCYATGLVSSSSYCGGVAGQVDAAAMVHDCVAWNKAIVGSNYSLFGSNGVSNCLAWNGIPNVTLPSNAKSEEELRAAIVAWGPPWHSDGKAGNGYPAFVWMVERADADVDEICGHPSIEEGGGQGGDEPVEVEAITEGDGTQSNPYLIGTAGQMLYVDSVLVHGAKTFFRLTTDIDMKNVVSWHPWNEANPFDIEIDFDGGGKTISNFKCSDANYASLFGVLYGCCHDLTLESPVVKSTQKACGILGGYIGTEGKPGTVKNVTVKHGLVQGEFTSDISVGGLCSNAREATIEDCTLDIEVINGSTSSNNRSATGGIVGRTISDLNVIRNCSFSGSVTSTIAEKYTGGVVGWQSASTIQISGCSVNAVISGKGERVAGIAGHFEGGTINGCTVKGSITSAVLNVGGIIGVCTSPTVIEDCRVEATVKSTSDKGADNVGGILAMSEGKTEIRRCTMTGNVIGYCGNDGGIAGSFGKNAECIIENCVCTGNVEGNQKVGGIAGDIYPNVKILDCYASGTITGWCGVGGIVGRAGGVNSWTWNADHGNEIARCIAWNTKITATRKDANGGSSGAIVGFTGIRNTLKDCIRKKNLSFDGSWQDKGLLCDQENADNTNPLSYTEYPGFDYIFPYHGKASGTGETCSAVARRLGWDETVWDLSSNEPKLK